MGLILLNDNMFSFVDADKLFKGKVEESLNGVQCVAKCPNGASQQKTETNGVQARSRWSYGPAAAAIAACAVNGSMAAAADGGDLIHLPGPLTEDAVLKALHSRFCATKMFVSINNTLDNITRRYYNITALCATSLFILFLHIGGGATRTVVPGPGVRRSLDG